MKLVHIQGQFLSFLDTYSSRILYFAENSSFDVISHRWYLHMKQSWISCKGSKLPIINIWGEISCHRHFHIVRIFWLGFIQDKITIHFWPITVNYRTVNGKLLAWIFTSQILKIEAPFAVLAWIYSSEAGDLLGFLARYV
jgi:hypothetical protein